MRACSRALPDLIRSENVKGRAAKAGFDYEDISQAMADLRSEVDELAQAIGDGDSAGVREELGDLLFSAVNVSRFAGVDAEECLSGSCDKFTARFGAVEKMARERAMDMKSADLEQLNRLWAEAKQ